jgi:hypothetical protein
VGHILERPLFDLFGDVAGYMHHVGDPDVGHAIGPSGPEDGNATPFGIVAFRRRPEYHALRALPIGNLGLLRLLFACM